MKRVAILQSNYIPWKGYFDLINYVDEFVFYDDVQYTRRDWRNRNKIKTENGLLWLTIPVQTKGLFDQRIRDTKVKDKQWAIEHLKAIHHSYSRAPFYREFQENIEAIYKKASSLSYLSEINVLFIEELCQILSIDTKLSRSSDFELADEKSERLLSICRQANATVYVSGPAAKSYLSTELFESEQIAVEWFNYDAYPEYEQLYPPFEHAVTILDLLFHTGVDAKSHLKGLGDSRQLT